MDKKLWHRQADESAKAFHAFMLYRDMLPKSRSIERVREILGKSAGYSRHLQNWSSRYQWVTRATAHDDYLAEVRSEAQANAIREMSERQAKIGMALQQIGLTFLQTHGLEEGRDAIRAVSEGAKIERVARGEPSEIVELQAAKLKSVEDYTDEELEWTIEHGKPIEAKYLIEKGG